MGLFSKTIDYNLILEQVLDGKRFSAHAKSLLLSMLYKIETSYQDYARVKQIKVSKDEFLGKIVKIIDDFFDVVKIVEPESDKAKILKENNVLALTNDEERSVLVYPTETAMLYAISDIGPKYYYMNDFVLKDELQHLLVDGNILNNIEIIEDFSGWSWYPKNIDNRDFVANIVYQNLIQMYGMDFIEKCKNTSSKKYCIIDRIKKSSNLYYKKLSEILFLKNIDNGALKNVCEEEERIKKIFVKYNNKEKIIKRKENLRKNIEKIEGVLGNPDILKKSFELKNSKLPDEKKFKDLEDFTKKLKNEYEEFTEKLNELELYSDPKEIENLKKQLEFYKNLKKINKNTNMIELVIELQEIFINLLYKKAKQIKTKEEFIDIIYKIRYYRNIYISKDFAIKDCEVLEKKLKKILRDVVTLGAQNAYIKMCSLNVNLNSNILINALDSKIMNLEDIRIKVEKLKNVLMIDVFENDVFEKRFGLQCKEEPEILVRQKRNIKIFL